MAYMNQEMKKELSTGIKSVLKKYGMKGSIAVRHHMTLVVNIKSGKLDIMQNWFDTVTKNGNGRVNGFGELIKKPEYLSVNQYWIDSNYSGTVKDFVTELYDAMKGTKWFDKSDIQSDYFHTAYYMDVNVGSWDKPYQFEG